MTDIRYSKTITTFRGMNLPEAGILAGYGAIIEAHQLVVPLPDVLTVISPKEKRYVTESWQVLTRKHQPQDTLYSQLVFALKYEGVNLSVLKSLFNGIDAQTITGMIRQKPHGQYSRRLWFLYEWLMQTRLPLPDLEQRSYIDLLNEKHQYGARAINSPRHRVRNNLPGTVDFCPLIRKTPTLETFIRKQLARKNNQGLKPIHREVLMRAAAFLLLKDSKASFAIEGESPPQNRALRWGKAIGQAGGQALTQTEILRLQQIVIDQNRFVPLGWRTDGGFVGIHDRHSATPIPDHISAKPEDLDTVMSGLIQTSAFLEGSEMDPVLVAAMIAFGFVFIHPLVDGNGRLHRYLIHHILARMGFAPQGLIFPVSAAILNNLADYRQTLEAYSGPRLELIEWKETQTHNVQVTNETIDLYRYFDATKQAEFLYRCVEETIEEIIPQEIQYLYQYDEMKAYLEQTFEMPDKLISLLIRFLEQHQGTLSQRARTTEFAELTELEVSQIEQQFQAIFHPASGH